MEKTFTRGKILNMPAGREMDALVWMAMNNQKPDLSMCRYVDGDYQPNAGYPVGHIIPPPYSKEIYWAWNALSKFDQKEWDICVYTHTDSEPLVWETTMCEYFEDGIGRQGKGEADTVPLAICRAILMATIIS